MKRLQDSSRRAEFEALADRFEQAKQIIDSTSLAAAQLLRDERLSLDLSMARSPLWAEMMALWLRGFGFTKHVVFEPAEAVPGAHTKVTRWVPQSEVVAHTP
jgi:hypothetical protein